VVSLRSVFSIKIDSIPLVIRDPNMVYIFPLYQPFINPLLHRSNTPVRQVLLTSSFDKERMTAVYQQLCFTPTTTEKITNRY
jgi:hypothetical protein